MAKLEGIRIKNFSVLKDITLGRVFSEQTAQPLTPLTVVIGKNGVGKSTLLDAFDFLSDCLKHGVEEAGDSRVRGGFKRLLSKGAAWPMEFEVCYTENGDARPITYELAIDLDETGRPYVSRERLMQWRKGQNDGQPFSFLTLKNGEGIVWSKDFDGIQEDGQSIDSLQSMMSTITEDSKGMEIVSLEDNGKLAIATLGSLKQHPRISAFCKFLRGWYFSYFSPDAARVLPPAVPHKRLSPKGGNLGNVVQFMERERPVEFRAMLTRLEGMIPGVDRIDTEQTPDGRLLIRFNDKAFEDPFYAQQVSDGTLKVLAYLLLLENPTPAPLICIEEPENGLYHKLLEILVREFRDHATGRDGGAQLFITTHQPYLVDALEPEEVWILEKAPNGFATVRRAGDDLLVKNLAAEGLPLGGLWYSDYIDAR